MLAENAPVGKQEHPDPLQKLRVRSPYRSPLREKMGENDEICVKAPAPDWANCYARKVA